MLRYVCMVCGITISEYPDVAQAPDQSPNVVSFCDKPECIAAASAQYKKGL